MERPPWDTRTLYRDLLRQIYRGVIMTMDISYAMLFLLWLAIVSFIVYGVWVLAGSSGR